MSDSKPTSFFEIIAIVISTVLFALPLLLLWSPFIFIAAVSNFFSGNATPSSSTEGSRPSKSAAKSSPSSGWLLLGATALLACFLWLLNASSDSAHSTPSIKTNRSAHYPSTGDVYVRGHYRRDGTYVPPHYRTPQNSDFWDNYSTHPNINPHTGKIGTHRTPPDAHHSTVWSVPRIAPSAPVPRSNHDRTPVTTTTTTSTATSAQRERIRLANELKQLGESVNWSDHSWSDLYDKKQRIQKANDLSRMGHQFDWRKHSWSELYDYQQRIQKAAEIQRLGYPLNWREFSWSELYDISQRIQKANDLARLGVRVDWRKHSWQTMYDAESELRRK